MKKRFRKVLPILLSLIIIVTSVGYTASSAFDNEVFSLKSPFEISSSFFSDESSEREIQKNINGLNSNLSVNKASDNSGTSGFIGFFRKVINFFKNIFSKLTTAKPSTTKNPTTTTKKPTTAAPKEEMINNSAFLNEAASALNAARKSAGTGKLRADSNMAKAAAVRAKELSRSFGHTRPDGRASSTVYADVGMTKPSSVAENIATAKGFDNAADIANVWLGSSSHKANIVNGKYTRFGMAWYKATDGKQYAVLLLANG